MIHKKNKNKKSGFSLIEIMVVVTIIAMLGGLVATSVMNRLDEANINFAKTHIGKYDSDLMLYKSATKKFPSKAEGLEALLKPVGLSKQPIRDSLLEDPWGNAYIYIPPSGKQKKPIVMTYGADAKKGGEGVDQDRDSLTILKSENDKED
jgi:general secretion pathway protein G